MPQAQPSVVRAVRSLRAALPLLTLILVLAAPAAALSVSGYSSSRAGGAPDDFRSLTGAESTVGPTAANGTCSGARGVLRLSATSGALALATSVFGAPGPVCTADSHGSGYADYQDNFTVQSGTLPPGTLVDLTLCTRVRIVHGGTFGCDNSVYEGVQNGAALTLSFSGPAGSASAFGNYSERWNCFDGHSLTETGLFAAGGAAQDLAITQVPVGAVVSVRAILSVYTDEASFVAADDGHVEVAVVFGYSSGSDVQLISTATAQECSPVTNCTESALTAWLPSPGSLAVEGAGVAPPLELAAPSPNPASAGVTLAFALPRGQRVELGVFDVTGARVARLASGWRPAGRHTLTWDGRDLAGRAARPGLYYVRLDSASGARTRPLVMRD